jgi:hypothetical protein
MPRIGSKGRVATPNLSDFDLFRMGFRLSQRGNLWREFEGRTLTVFARKDGDGYMWCVVSPEHKEYSDETFDTQDEAITDLWRLITGL